MMAAYLRFAVRFAAMLAALFVCLSLHFVWRLIRRPSPWPGRFLAAVTRAFGAKVRVAGRVLRTGVLHVANHVSVIDGPILGGVTGTSFVAKIEIASWPLIGWLMRINHTVFVRREGRMSVGGQVADLRAAIAAGRSVMIFPEGTITDGTWLRSFKAPLFAAICPPPAPVMVQPVFMDFAPVGAEVMYDLALTPFANFWRAITRPGTYEVRLNFLPPFNPLAFAGRKAVCAEARRRIGAALAAGTGADSYGVAVA